MLYLTQNTNKLPRISAENAANLVLIDQITKKSYTYPLTDAGNWYEFTISEELPTSQFDAQALDSDGVVLYTLVAQYGEYERKNTQYKQDHNITTYKG